MQSETNSSSGNLSFEHNHFGHVVLRYFNMTGSFILGGFGNILDFWLFIYHAVGNGLDYLPLESLNDDVRQKRLQEGKYLSQITRPI